MAAIIVVAVLVGLGFWYARRGHASASVQTLQRAAILDSESRRVAIQAEIAAAELQRAEQKDRDRAAWQHEWTSSCRAASAAEERLKKFTLEHMDTLFKKQRQLAFVDDYGRTDISAFIRELEYFVEKVVPHDIRQPQIEHHGDTATLMMVGTVRICMLQDHRASIQSSSTYTSDMAGVEFERLVAERLVSAGADVRFTPITGDQGADLLVKHNGVFIAVQCKRSASTIGNGAVQEAHAGRQFYEADRAWVVSDAPFSRSARQLASSLSVRLVDFDQVEGAL